MSRVLKRVPLDFYWPLNKVWEGYLLPGRLHETKCPDCKNGFSNYAEELHYLWYGRDSMCSMVVANGKVIDGIEALVELKKLPAT